MDIDLHRFFAIDSFLLFFFVLFFSLYFLFHALSKNFYLIRNSRIEKRPLFLRENKSSFYTSCNALASEFRILFFISRENYRVSKVRIK